MYKMLIVDDEEITRQGIEDSVNWRLMDIEVVGEASNGLEAMLMINDLSPDIIICDIRMPKLDGISLMNEIQPQYPNMQVIFLSGYSDKEYLKKAICLDAVDYIFKPFQLHELIAAVEKAKKNCAEKKTNCSVENSNLALDLLNYSQDECQKINASSFPVNLSAPMVSLVIRLEEHHFHPEEYMYDNGLNEKLLSSRYYGQFKSAAEKIFGKACVISCLANGYIIHANAERDFFADPGVRTAFDEFFKIEKKEKEFIALGVGNVYNGFPGIRDGYRQACKAAEASFLVGYGKTIFYRELSQAPFKPFSDLNDEFYGNILKNKFTPAITWLHSYFDYMHKCRVADIPQIKDILASIAFWLDKKVKNPRSGQQSHITDLINHAAVLSEIEEFILNYINQYIDDISNLDNKERVVLEVEQYIVNHFNENLSIRTIASQVFVTPNYLCYLYKKKTGKTINQFILEIKMEHAKKMICETRMKLGSISETLGYSNQNYFTKLFTKYYGMAPKAYRSAYGIVSPEPKNSREGIA